MRSFFYNMPPVTKNLLIINVALWLVMELVPSLGHSLTAYCALYFPTSPAFRIWQPITYMFLHGGFTHLFFNMFTLVMIGSTIEWAMGSKRYLFYYISCGLFAGLIQLGVFALMLSKYYDIYTPEQMEFIIQEAYRYPAQFAWNPTISSINALVNSPMVGASGAVYGILLAMGMLFPNQSMYMMFIPVPIKAKWLVLGFAVIELSLGLGNVADNVAHFAHLGGMIVGLFLILYWKKKGVFNNHWFF